MTRQRYPRAVSVAVVLFAAAAVPVAAQAVESAEQLQKLYDNGSYAELLPKLNAALALKGPAAAGYDRYQLLMLKGEAQLRTAGAAASVAAFRAAAAATTDDKQVAEARATAALMVKTQGTKYRPKLAARVAKAPPSTAPTSYDVTVATERKQAFVALFAEMSAAAGTTVDRASKATSLQPLTQAAASLGDLRPVELQATGSDTQSKALLKSVGERAVELMTAATTQLDQQIAKIDQQTGAGNNGNQQQQQRGGRNNTLRGNGGANVNVPGAIPGMGVDGLGGQAAQPTLSASNESALRDAVATARKIDAAATSMAPTFGDAVDFTAVKAAASKAAADANAVLKKYGKAAVQ